MFNRWIVILLPVLQSTIAMKTPHIVTWTYSISINVMSLSPSSSYLNATNTLSSQITSNANYV